MIAFVAAQQQCGLHEGTFTSLVVWRDLQSTTSLILRLAAVAASTAGVFFGSDFVTVTKSDDYNWPVLKPDVFAAIMDHFSSGDPLFTDKDTLAASDTAIHEDDDEVGFNAAASVAACCLCSFCFSPCLLLQLQL
jgi:hypothetical protein